MKTECARTRCKTAQALVVDELAGTVKYSKGA
jgi:hypothetical protein